MKKLITVSLIAIASLSACSSTGSASYKSCADYRSSFIGPKVALVKGQPDYNKKLDADGDGVACDK